MKKIPLQSLDEKTPAPSSTYLADALDILLLGGVWSFVLVTLPVVQTLDPTLVAVLLPVLVKAQGIVSALLAMLVVFLRWQPFGNAPHEVSGRELAALIACAFLGVVLVLVSLGVIGRGDVMQYVLALQAVVALGYFMARRLVNESP